MSKKIIITKEELKALNFQCAEFLEKAIKEISILGKKHEFNGGEMAKLSMTVVSGLIHSFLIVPIENILKNYQDAEDKEQAIVRDLVKKMLADCKKELGYIFLAVENKYDL